MKDIIKVVAAEYNEKYKNNDDNDTPEQQRHPIVKYDYNK
jgi:hypothetical protein